MKRWRNKLLLLGGCAGLGLAIPAFSQDAPESILPPGFEQPAPLPPRAEPPRPQAPLPPSTPVSSESGAVAEASAEDVEALTGVERAPPIELPEFARRPTDRVGTLGPENWGLGDGAFGRTNGQFLSTLMRRIDAPLPSRWTSILLRRALLSRVDAPPGVQPVDWVAERAWLLLRMGEADAARMLVQAVDVGDFTPKMFSVAVQTALATADPAALCPLIDQGRKTSDEAVWTLSDAMCAALKGEASRASTLIGQARSRGLVRGIDLLLAEKVVGAGTDTRRAVTLQWDDVDALSSWRFGLAAATGAEIPEPLMLSAGSQMRAWQARAAMIPLDQRVGAAQTAAALGVFSNASLVEMYSLQADGMDVTEIGDSVGGRLRIAYGARDTNARLAALRSLWADAKTPTDIYARHILTAVAASRIPVSNAFAADAPDLIASMLAAGMDRQAARWSAVVAKMDDGPARYRAWAMLAIASPQPRVDIDSSWIGGYRDADDSIGDYRSGLLGAALAGLGRIDAGDAGVDLDRQNLWTRAIDQAARARQPGTVALLAAAAMQTPEWRGVPPEHLYRIVRALRQAGLDYEARMIAVEALARA